MDVAQRLRAVCDQVSTEPAALTASAKDRWTMAASVARPPDAVAQPSTAEEVGAVLALCSSDGVPVTPA
ncbi:MAG: FAD-binding oxidoreductase, partial [Actinomycetota bacterium]|nr:FAD-binding oxidoreductase [Actinomycetota bacterium]